MHDADEGAPARIRSFLDVAARLEAARIRVPRIFESDEEAGYMLLEDLGSLDLAACPDAAHYARALALYSRLGEVDCEGLPRFDEAIYSEELSRFCRFYLAPLGVEDCEILELARPCFEEFASCPPCFTHVDFHAENILIYGGEDGGEDRSEDKDEGTLALIDFQDARAGHRLYDLASLVDDVRITPPPRFVDHVLGELDLREKRDFAALSAQRLFKIIGIFARLSAKGHEKYARLMPRTMTLLEARLEARDLSLWREWYLDVVPRVDAGTFFKMAKK